MSREVRRRLEDAGRQPVPDVDPSFAEALEARLLAVAASAPPSPEPPRRRGPSRWVRVAASGATLAVAALVIALVVAGTRPPADDAVLVALELVAPVNVEVALADGTTLEDPDGLVLPEGTVIVVGDGGSARIGETVLRPGDIATVEHGDLRVEHRGVVGSVPATPGPSGARADCLALAGRDARADARPDPSTRRDAEADADAATPAPTSGGMPPTPAPTPATAAPPTVAPRPRRPRPPRSSGRGFVPGSSTARASLSVDRDLSRPFVRADRDRGGSGPAPDPVYPGSRVIGTFARPPELPLRFRVPAGVHGCGSA